MQRLPGGMIEKSFGEDDDGHGMKGSRKCWSSKGGLGAEYHLAPHGAPASWDALAIAKVGSRRWCAGVTAF
jgi:hypothetical protein